MKIIILQNDYQTVSYNWSITQLYKDEHFTRQLSNSLQNELKQDNGLG